MRDKLDRVSCFGSGSLSLEFALDELSFYRVEMETWRNSGSSRNLWNLLDMNLNSRNHGEGISLFLGIIFLLFLLSYYKSFLSGGHFFFSVHT